MLFFKHRTRSVLVLVWLLILAFLGAGTLSAAGVCLPTLSVRSDRDLLIAGIEYMQKTGRLSGGYAEHGLRGDTPEEVIAQNPACCSVSDPTVSFRSAGQWVLYYLARYKNLEINLIGSAIKTSVVMDIDNCGNIIEYGSIDEPLGG